MSLGTFAWVASALWSRVRSKNGLASSPDRLCLATSAGRIAQRFDRVLATRYGLGAIDMAHRGEFGRMAALRGNKIVSVPLAEATLRIARWTGKFSTPQSAFSTSSAIRLRKPVKPAWTEQGKSALAFFLLIVWPRAIRGTSRSRRQICISGRDAAGRVSGRWGKTRLFKRKDTNSWHGSGFRGILAEPSPGPVPGILP